MEIVHISSAHPENDTRIFIKMCRGIVEAGHVVHLVISSEKMVEDRSIDGVLIHPVRKQTGRLKRMVLSSKQVMEKAASIKADIYHFHDPELLRLAAKYQKKLKRPFIYDAHEDIREAVLNKRYLPVWGRRFISWYVGRVEDQVCRDLAVISATPHIGRRFNENENHVTINNYPLVDELRIDDSKADHSSKERTRFIYIGGMTPQRGIYEMIQAVKRTSASIILCGTWCSNAFREKVLGNVVDDRIVEAGFLSRGELACELAEAIAGIVLFLPGPNHTHSQPNKMFEYMAAGVPLIASDFPLWKTIIEDNKCGVCVNPKDIVAIAGAIDYLSQNPEEAKQMGENGRRLVKEKLNWNIELKKLLCFYEKLC